MKPNGHVRLFFTAAFGLATIPYAWASGDAKDSLFSQQWALKNTGQSVCGMDGTCEKGTAGADIRAVDAWKVSRDCTNALVVVLDTGADASNPDLTSNIVGGTNIVAGTDDFTDDNLHGSHVTGTIAANGEVDGICQTAKVLEVKVADAEGRLADSDIVDGFNYAVQKGAKVVNASFGGPGNSSAFKKAIQAAPGTLLVVAAGNDGTSNDTTPSYPANYGLPNIIVVAASDAQDQLTSFSNYGPKTVNLAAPGLGILSTTPLQATDEMLQNNIPTGHALLDGTSMATPHVTGAVALYWSNHADATAQDVKKKVLASVDKLSSLSGKISTGGRLNLAQLLN
jgi:subtilisin family serine protease